MSAVFHWALASAAALAMATLIGSAVLQACLPWVQAAVDRSGAELELVHLSVVESQHERKLSALVRGRPGPHADADYRERSVRSMVKIDWTLGPFFQVAAVALLCGLAWPASGPVTWCARATLICLLGSAWIAFETWVVVSSVLSELLGDRGSTQGLAWPVWSRLLEGGARLPLSLLLALAGVRAASVLSVRISQLIAVLAHPRPVLSRSGSSAVVVGALCIMAFGLIPTPAVAIMAGLSPDTPAMRIDPNTAASPWAGVGAVLVDDASFSGVAIGPRHVLTAAHVVGDGNPVRIRFQINASSTPVLIQASQVVIHPGFSGFNTPNLNDDLAVIVLATDLPAGVPTYTLNRGSPAPGIEFRMVGYGGSGQANGTGRIGADRSVKRVGGNTADRYLADDDGSGLAEIFLFDFDGVGAQNFIGAAGLGNSIESSLASGDSGSPSFLVATSPPVLFGINTFLSGFQGSPADPGTLGTGGGGMVISTYANWIDSVVASTQPAPVNNSADVPLPAWVYGLMVGAIGWRARRARRTESTIGY
jgi:hypothetical protein